MVRDAAVAAGRDPSSLGMEGRVDFGDGDSDRLARTGADWRGAGASHLAVNTMRAGLASVDDHLAALAKAFAAVNAS